MTCVREARSLLQPVTAQVEEVAGCGLQPQRASPWLPPWQASPQPSGGGGLPRRARGRHRVCLVLTFLCSSPPSCLPLKK